MYFNTSLDMPSDGEKTPDTELDNLNKQKQDLEKQIDDLKGQVLDEQEKQVQLNKLEEEKKKIEDQILQSSTQEQSNLKQDVEQSNNANPQTLEIIKETGLYTKLQETFKDESIYPDLNGNIEAKIDRFSNQINTTVQKYLESIFLSIGEKQFPPAALQSINTGIQFMFMDGLKNSSNNASFFSGIGNVNLNGFKSLFEGLTKTFGKSGEFLSTGKKITKTIDFLSLQPTLWDNADKIPQLMNPYKFIQLANNQKLQGATDITALSLSDLSIQEGDTNMTQAEKDSLQKIAENSAIKNDPKTIKAIIGALGKANLFLEKRKDLANGALDMMDKANGMFAPFEKLLGVNMFDMLKPFKGVLNMILSLLGFSGGLDGLHRKRLARKIDGQLDTQSKKDFISDSMDYFKDNITKSSVKESDSGSILTLFSTEIGTISDDIKPKIPLDYDIICDSIKNNLTDPEVINPSLLQSMGLPWSAMLLETLGSKGEKIYKVDKAQFAGKETEFIKSYTNLAIPRLIKDAEFMKDIKGQDEFGLAVMGGIVVDSKTIIDSVKTKAIIPSQYLTAVTVADKAKVEAPTDQAEDQIYKGEIKKETTKYQDIVDVIIDKIEGGYYHPDMNISGMGSSGETMMGIDRKNGGTLNTSEAGKEFWGLIDADRSKNPNLWKHLYFGGDLQPKLRTLAGAIIQPHYENLSTKYLSAESIKLVNTDGRLLFNFIYGAWNGAGWFEEMANVINSKVTSGISNTDDLLKAVVQFRTQNDNSLIAQGGRKIEEIVGIA
ncbi:MAG: hypothetical protein WAZ12_02260 [Candidatus Absconditicoccaceae bacterium]